MATLLSQARAYAKAHPTRDGRTWDQWCASLMVRFNGMNRSYLSAIIAYRASTIVSKDYTKAPVGAFHFWSIGKYGHVGQDVTGGGRTVFMATRNLTESLGNAIGLIGVNAYSKKTGAVYLGWSRKYGVLAPRAASDLGKVYKPTAVKAPSKVPAYKWVEPDKATQKAIQQALKAKRRYTGPTDGDWGKASIKGIQETIRTVGYTGIIDGKAGQQTCHYVQVFARDKGGYKGKVDNTLEKDVWAAFLKGLKK